MSVDEFEDLRPLLFSIAYRILGSVGEAEDAVQETWIRYQASATPPLSLKSFLCAIVTRVSIDVLRSARVRRAGAVWVDLDEAQRAYFGQPVGVRMPDGRVWNPLGKVVNRFELGREESLQTFYLTLHGRGGDRGKDKTCAAL